jgi:hypothetical protein
LPPAPSRCLLCLLALDLISSPAAAAARLSLSRAAQAMDCPDSASLAGSVERILGRPVFAAEPGQPPVFVEVSFTRDGADYEGSVRLVGAKEGVRVLRDPGPGCGALAEAMAVTVALLLDNEPRRAASPASPPPVSAAPPTPASAAPPPPEAPLAGDPLRAEAWLTAGGALGQVGAASAALGAEALVGRRRLGSLALGGLWITPREQPLGPGSVRVSLTSGYLRACASVAEIGSAQASICGGPEVGLLSGDSSGFRVRSPATMTWVALGLGAQLNGELGARLLWGLRASAVVPVRQQSFSVAFVGVGYESQAVAGVLQMALGLRLF